MVFVKVMVVMGGNNGNGDVDGKDVWKVDSGIGVNGVVSVDGNNVICVVDKYCYVDSNGGDIVCWYWWCI